MSSWVTTVLISFGKALLISLSILIGSCCVRFLYRLWIKRFGCSDRSDELSESCKYEMELQSDQELNHVGSNRRCAQDAISEIELPPSPGANTSCPPYNTHSLFPDKCACDDFSDNFSEMWRQDPLSEGGEMTDAELTSMAGETTTVCSVLTGNEDHFVMESPPPPKTDSPPFPRLHTPPPPRCESSSPPENHSPLPEVPHSPPPEFQDYQCYSETTTYPTPSLHRRDRGSQLFLSQYYKSLEHDLDCSGPSPQV